MKEAGRQQSASSSIDSFTANMPVRQSVVLLPIACSLILLFTLLPLESTAQRSRNSKPHSEDLTDHRLQFPAVEDSILKLEDEPEIKFLPPDHAVTEKVNTILDSIARFNKGRLFIDGYTIQIYSGLKREEAMNAKKKMMDEVKDIVADIHYQQPKWRLRTGSYFTRMEAQRDLHRLKRIFPTAILVPEKVALK